ncbi:MAG: DUF4249 family protein [Flavobacteriales bacterium]
MSSCNWFNPYDSPKTNESLQVVSYFLPLENDSSVCFISKSMSLHSPNEMIPQDLCIEVSGNGDFEPIISCSQVQSDTASVWLNTSELFGLEPGDSIHLLIESPEFETILGSTVVPERPIVSSYNLTSRTWVSGDKVFDELEVQLNDPSPNSDEYMLQLIRSVDTIGASPPRLINIKTEDPNLQVRKFGRTALDNALLFGDSHWEEGHYNAQFRTRNNIEEGVPYHYTLLIHGISRDMADFFSDLENGDFYGTFTNGSENFIRSNIAGAEGCFGAMKTKTILIFP